jgi:hypothetical protein
VSGDYLAGIFRSNNPFLIDFVDSTCFKYNIMANKNPVSELIYNFAEKNGVSINKLKLSECFGPQDDMSGIVVVKYDNCYVAHIDTQKISEHDRDMSSYLSHYYTKLFEKLTGMWSSIRTNCDEIRL